MTQRFSTAGFTAVELLVTLFVAAAFLLAGYQLFNVVIRDGGNTRVEASASNVAYNYLRLYSDSTTNPCAPSTPLVNSPITVEGTTNATVSISITCPQGDALSLSQVEVIINYGIGADANTVKFATYVDKSKGATPNNDITNGLMEWWKLNGNMNSSAGSTTLYNEGVRSTTGQDGNAIGAYAFSPTDSKAIRADNFSARMVGLPEFSITAWINAGGTPPGNFPLFAVMSKDGSYGVYALQAAGTNDIECHMNPGGATSYSPSPLTKTSGWQLLSLVYTGSTIRCYLDNTPSTAVAADWSSFDDKTGPLMLGQNDRYDLFGETLSGSIDDVRIYDRALSTSEISQLVNNGAK